MVSHGHGLPTKFLQIKQDDKFFSRLLAKEEESSKNESSSSRVFSYYGGAAGAVPFLWESQPGTPKHAFSDASSLPPLTPPPSYQLTPQMAMESSTQKRSKSKVFHSIFPRVMKTHMSPSYSSSSISSSSSSNSYSLPSTPMNNNVRSKLIPRSRTPVYYGVDEDENDDDHLQQQLPKATMSPTSTLCFGGTNGGRRSARGGHYYPMKSLRKAIFSMVGHGTT